MTFRGTALALLLALTLPALAQPTQKTKEAKPSPSAKADAARADATKADAAKPPAKPESPHPNPLPADKSAAQTITVHGKTLHYTATVGTITLKDKDGKPTGDVVYTAYTLDGPHNADRPVTFAFNGGPGASSAFLNMGAIGPQHITNFGNQGDSPSDPATLTANPATWLDFTDLVFLDPIGTGFSRSLVDDAQTKKLFYTPTPDVDYLSLVIYKWLVKNDRLLSKKYLIGESYGGYRGPRVTHYLQTQLGVAMNGLFLVSPYLNPDFGNGNLSPIPWMVTMPSMAAAHLESEGKLTPDAMQQVIAYDEGPYAQALLHGRTDTAATQAMIQHVTDLTGLDPQFVKYAGGRIDTQAYLREIHREKGEIGSVYDSNVTAPDPFPYAPYQETNDPLLESMIAPLTQAMVNFVTNTVGWKTEARYSVLSDKVNNEWDRKGTTDLRKGAVPDLREALAADPKLNVVILHGWSDLACPFMGSVLTDNQLPKTLAGQVQIHEYPGGHMFYTRPANDEALHQLAEQTVAAH